MRPIDTRSLPVGGKTQNLRHIRGVYTSKLHYNLLFTITNVNQIIETQVKNPNSEHSCGNVVLAYIIYLPFDIPG